MESSKAASSSWSFRISSPVNLDSCIARMASACLSVKLSLAASFFDFSDLNLIPSVFPSIRQVFACLMEELPLRISIIRSITSVALINPPTISRRFLALSRR